MSDQDATKRNIRLAATPTGMVMFQVEGQEAVYLTPDGANDVANKLKTLAHEARRMKFQLRMTASMMHGPKEN